MQSITQRNNKAHPIPGEGSPLLLKYRTFVLLLAVLYSNLKITPSDYIPKSRSFFPIFPNHNLASFVVQHSKGPAVKAGPPRRGSTNAWRSQQLSHPVNISPLGQSHLQNSLRHGTPWCRNQLTRRRICHQFLGGNTVQINQVQHSSASLRPESGRGRRWLPGRAVQF